MKKKLTWLLLVGVAGYWILRRLGTRGGASDEEVHASLPGDDVIPHPMVETTHAIRIEAPPSVVWKWLMQAGYRGSGRAGWYSDPWLLKLTEGIYLRLTVPARLRAEHPRIGSADELLPEFQYSEVGDIVPDGPPGTVYFVVKAVEPERAWVLYSDTHIKYLSPIFLHGTDWEARGEFTWVFVLNPANGSGTRLILRTRARYGPPLFRRLFMPLFYIGEAIIPRLILRGIKKRAETMPATMEIAPESGRVT